MALRFAEIAFTPGVKTVQEEMGSRGGYERFESPDAPSRDRLGPDEAEFLAARDSFYLATVSETGWPYVQHRGGPPGFLKILDAGTVGFADVRGNRQYVSVGNLRGDDRVSIILMDYARRRRLKMLGHARAVDAAEEPDLVARLSDPAYGARVERGIVIRVAAFDWNCPQHITPRFTEAEVRAMAAPLAARLREAEAERDRLRAMLEERSVTA